MSRTGSTARALATLVAKRVIAAAVTVFILAIVVFLFLKAIPGDEAHVAAGAAATPAQVAAVRHELGLDRPLPDQLWSYLDRLVHGNLGTSVTTHAPVAAGLAQALPETLELVVLAAILMVVITFPAAMYAVLRPDQRGDTATRLGVLLLAAIPTFWLALELQQLLTVQVRAFPVSGVLSPGFTVPRRTGAAMLDSLLAGNIPAFSNAFQHLLLPAFVLMIPFGAALFRALRAELLAVLQREHIVVAQASGISTVRLMLRHALPNAMGPALTVIGIEVGNMVGASVLVEAVFGINGMGSYLTTAVNNDDVFAVLAGVLVIGVIVVCTSLVVDVLQLVRDPRVRLATIGA